MKSTVFTVIAVVLLLATLCLSAAAQTWVLENSTSGADDDTHRGMFEVEFRDNNQVFFSKWDRLYKWDLDANWLWWWDHGGGNTVDNIEVPRSDSSVFIYTVGDWLLIRDADNHNMLASREVVGNILSLDVDEGGFYAAVQFAVTAGNIKARIYDIWGSNGWQFITHGTKDNLDGANLILHPTDDTPRWFAQKRQGDERFYEYTWSWFDETDTFVTTRWDHIDKIAARPKGNFRLAALDSGNVIHVWNWMGDHLFTFNQSEGFSAADHILEFTPNGELLVTAYEKNVRFWDMSTRELDHSFTVAASSGDIVALAFSDNGKLMAIGDAKGIAYIYRWTGGNAPAAPAQEVEPALPTALLSNYPNPFNPETWIPYQLSAAAEVAVTIHSSDGKLVRTLELGQVPAGVYSDKERAAYWDGRNAAGEPVASGVYFYTLRAGDFSATRKMVIRK